MARRVRALSRLLLAAALAGACRGGAVPAGRSEAAPDSGLNNLGFHCVRDP